MVFSLFHKANIHGIILLSRKWNIPGSWLYFVLLGFTGIAKLFILAKETACRQGKWVSSTGFLTINTLSAFTCNYNLPFGKLKKTKPQWEISDAFNHKLNLLINSNSLCFFSSLKTLFEPANSTGIINGILKRI